MAVRPCALDISYSGLVSQRPEETKHEVKDNDWDGRGDQLSVCLGVKMSYVACS